MGDPADGPGGQASPEGVAKPDRVPPDRLSTLDDGVFAIAMTLLVLELAVPEVADAGLAAELAGMWAEFLMYTLSFLVLGVYWVIHHMIYDSITQYDTTLAWLNIVTSTACFYGVNLLVPFLLGWSMGAYATSRHRLVADDIDDELVRGGRQMGYVYGGLLAAAVAAAFINPVALVYAGVVLVFAAFTTAGPWQAVAIRNGPPGSNHRRNDTGQTTSASQQDDS